ncbi:MAG: acylphosphatase [Candidatus Obscuribacterales bacterium]|nr:acylphosphatase [Candidatus Obscuribacterales bacterium]
MQARVKLHVKGRVQGVFYRQSTLSQARHLGLCGWVANEMDGSVKIDAQGEKAKLESLLLWCHKGPPSAIVLEMDVEWLDELDSTYSSFEVRR